MNENTFYRDRTVISGRQIEHYHHDFPVPYGKSRHGGGRKPGGGTSTRTNEYRKRTSRTARQKVVRLINTNFSDQARDSYKFITLTFRDGALQDVGDVQAANVIFKKYMRKLREICKKADRDLRYLCVIEFQDTNGRGAVHFHLIADIPVIPVTAEKGEEWIMEGKLPADYDVKQNHFDLWGQGSLSVKAITVSQKDLETGTRIETRNIGEYVTQYMVKDMGDDRLRGSKAYWPSKGLEKPTVLFDKEARSAIQGIEKENVVREDCYLDTYHRTPVYYMKAQK